MKFLKKNKIEQLKEMLLDFCHYKTRIWGKMQEKENRKEM